MRGKFNDCLVNFGVVNFGIVLCVGLQLFTGNDADEFSLILKRESNPKILITTCRFHSSVCTFHLPCFFTAFRI